MQRRKSAIRSPVSLDADGSKPTLVQRAAKVGYKPISTDSAAVTNVRCAEFRLEYSSKLSGSYHCSLYS